MGESFDKSKALSFCDSAISNLDESLVFLRKASGWGIVDILGGGLLTTFLKHSNYEKAKTQIRNAGFSIRQLADCVREHDGAPELNEIDISGLLVFADYFLDGFLADFLVQAKISKTRKKVEDALEVLRGVRGRLC